MSPNALHSYVLDSKGKLPRVAQHPEATGLFPAVLGLVVMDVLHSSSYTKYSHSEQLGYPRVPP